MSDSSGHGSSGSADGDGGSGLGYDVFRLFIFLSVHLPPTEPALSRISAIRHICLHSFFSLLLMLMLFISAHMIFTSFLTNANA